MLFAVCREGAQISDHYGPLTHLVPPRDLQRVGDDEVYVLFDEAPHTYRGYDFLWRRDTQGPGLPEPLDAAAWERIRAAPRRLVRVLVFNGFGAGYGDALVGSVIVENIYRRLASAGHTPQIDFLVHPYSFERQRHFEVYKLNPFIHALHFTTIRLDQYKTFDYFATSEEFVKDLDFRQTNVCDYFLEKVGLAPDECDRQLRLYPDPAVLAEVEAEVAPWRKQDGGRPIVLVNFFATPLRAIPRFKWLDFVRELAPDYRLAFTSDADSSDKLRAFLGELPEELRARTIDLSTISAKSFDHLIGVLHHGVDAVVTPDTSLVHLCGGLGKPCVCIFFTIEPSRVCKHYPTVVPYCHDEFRRSSFWGQSKIHDEEKRKVPIQEDPEWQDLWRSMKVRELRAKLDAAWALPRHPPCLPQPVYLARGARPKVLVYTGTAVPTAADCNDYNAILPQILPDDCDVEVLTARPLEFHGLGQCDLLIYGLGDWLYEPILRQPGLVRFLAAARRRLGVFGFQYPDSVPQDIARDLVACLDHWFVTCRRDLDIYGGLCRRSTLLGQWQALSVPMNPWQVDRELTVVEQAARTNSWAENLRLIQAYRRVTCGTVHSLLCALGSADEIRYRDPRAYKDQPSHRPEAVLADILGQAVPEDRYFPVSAEAFIAYKRQVRAGVDTLRAEIREILG